MAKTATATPGKTSFLKEFLHDHPQGNARAVNEAWQAAGFDGTISPTLVNKTRALLGLTGNLRGRTKASATGKKRGRPRKDTAAAVDGKSGSRSPGRTNSRTQALTEVEAEIDRLIFKMMEIGNLTAIEDSLRHARRLLYATMTGK